MAIRTKSARAHEEGGEPPAKRVRFDAGFEKEDTLKAKESNKPSSTQKESKKPSRTRYTSVGELRAALKNQNPTTLLDALTAARNQLSISPHEGPVSPSDPRLLLAAEWMDVSPGAGDLFTIWDTTTPRQPALPTILTSLLSVLLVLLSTHYTHHAVGHPILKTLLTPPYLQKLNAYIGGGNNDLILSTLKLFCAMAEFGSGKEKKAVLEGFGWEIKAIPKLFTMRRRGKEASSIDVLKKPDIRTLLIKFTLSFLSPTTPSSTKSLMLTQHSHILNHIFKGLHADSYAVIRWVFEVFWALWADPKVGKSLKVTVFGENTINHILKLYDRSTPEASPSPSSSSEDEQDEEIPADLAHHFLLAICTRPGTGICFKDRGWYPREEDSSLVKEDGEQNGTGKARGKIYNKILSNVIRNLKVNEDARQQELGVMVLKACPELVAGYWPSAALTLEPRLSSRWLANIALFGTIISLPIPTSSFLLPSPSLPPQNTTSHQMYNPTPPPLAPLLENTLPNVHLKAHFTKGLQSTSGLVAHCTASALVRCLQKYVNVREEMGRVAEAIGEDFAEEGKEGTGMWRRRMWELEREARRRVPEFSVVVAFAHGTGSSFEAKEKEKGDAKENAKKHDKDDKKDENIQEKGQKKENEVRRALLSEIAHRLMRVYQQAFPSVVLEARYDVGKLLLSFDSASGREQDAEEAKGEGEGEVARLDRVKSLHVLRILKESEGFVWTGKAGTTTYLKILLTQLTSTWYKAIYNATFELLSHVLSSSTLFSESVEGEAGVWLSSLPRSTSESQAVVAFVDDCVSRCLKVVYKYLEELEELHAEGEGERASPLVMTVLEQLQAKLEKKLVSARDTLAIVTFLRKVVYRLCALGVSVRGIVQRVDGVLQGKVLGDRVAEKAIRREVGMMRVYCALDEPALGMPGEKAQAYLREVESVPTGNTDRIKAHELVDWVRLVGEPLGPAEVGRMAGILEKSHPAAIEDLVQNLPPRLGLFWDGMGISDRFGEVAEYVSFEWLFADAGPKQVTDEQCRSVLTKSLFSAPRLAQVQNAVRLISQWISSAETSNVKKGLYLFLAEICTAATTELAEMELHILKEMLFGAGIVKESMMSLSVDDQVDEGLSELVRAALNPASAADRKIALDISMFWLAFLRTGLSGEGEGIKTAYRWLKYLDPVDLFDILDSSKFTGGMSRGNIARLLKEALEALSIRVGQAHEERSLIPRLPQLLSLLRLFPNGDERLEVLIAGAMDASVPVGLNGLLIRAEGFEEKGISTVIKRAEACFAPSRLAVSLELDVDMFLARSRWTDATVKILVGLLYRTRISKDMFISWLETESWAAHDNGHVIPVLHAFLDISGPIPDKTELWTQVLTYTARVTSDEAQPMVLRDLAKFCTLRLILQCTERKALIANLLQTVENPKTALTPELVSLGKHLLTHLESDATDVVSAIVDRGIHWSTRALGDSAVDSAVVDELVELVKLFGKTKPHLVETLISVVVQVQLGNVSALSLGTVALKSAALKPVIVNRFIQTVTQNPQFFKICASTSPERETLVDFLYELFILHPSNTCQVSHIQPLIRVYHGTISNSDLKILSIFQLFETERKVSVAPLLSQWSATPNSQSSTALEAIQSLDPTLTLRTCLHFPTWRKMEGQVSNTTNEQLCDPVFVMLLFTQMMTEGPPTTAFGWIELFRTNAVGLFIRALSSRDNALREVALAQVAALWKHLESADLQEKPHVLRILTLLKNVFPPPVEDEPPRRLPSYTTLLLMHALRGIFYPSNFIYPLTARFLLQRPELDTGDVPMLYGMLYSSTDDWKKERGWMLRFLSDGLVSKEDWTVFKRRHTWDLLASLFQSTQNDRALRHGVLEVLASVTTNVQAATSLVLKSSLLAWIEMNIRESRTDQIEWVKVIENLVVSLDSAKIETATNGRWRETICRCLVLLLADARNANVDSIFPSVVPLILRLGVLAGPPALGMSSLLDEAVKFLLRLEVTVEVPAGKVERGAGLGLAGVPCPPHRAHGLHELPHVDDPLLLWGSSVEMLWRAAMGLVDKPACWDALTSRLLVWRAIAGVDGSSVGEWARKEAIRNII